MSRSTEALVRPTAAERAAVLAGDEVVSPADVVMDRAFTLGATPAQVWPWLVQLGKHRGGWYLPQWLERLVPPPRRALRRLDPALLDLAPGDVIPDWGGRHATFTVASIEVTRHLLFTSVRGHTRLTWCLTVSALGDQACRVHLRLRLAPVRHPRVAHWAGGVIDLLTVAALAAGLRERVGRLAPEVD